MKLWLVSQDENDGWETYDSMIVAAETEEEARNTLPPYCTWGEVPPYASWCRTPAAAGVKYIGEAAPGILTGVVLASFNAG